MMPSFNVVPFANQMNQSRWHLYGGAEIGPMHVNTRQTKSFSENEVPIRVQITIAHINLRAELSCRIGPYANIAGEGTMFFTFTDNPDGNMGFNRYSDHLAEV